MTKRKTPGLWLVFAAACLLGGLILLFPSYRFSGWVILGIAGLVLCYQLLSILAPHRPQLARILHRCLSVCVCLGILVATITGFLIVRAGSESTAPSCDYLIVLGAGVNGSIPSLTLRERLDAAYDYLETHPDTLCIVSGGQGPGEEITEAACMANWLMGKGISPERILLEDQATSTKENLAFSLDLITQRTGTRPLTVGIVSSEYHLYRTSLLARDQNVQPILIPARTSWLSLRINYYLREIVGVWHYLIFG